MGEEYVYRRDGGFETRRGGFVRVNGLGTSNRMAWFQGNEALVFVTDKQVQTWRVVYRDRFRYLKNPFQMEPSRNPLFTGRVSYGRFQRTYIPAPKTRQADLPGMSFLEWRKAIEARPHAQNIETSQAGLMEEVLDLQNDIRKLLRLSARLEKRMERR